MTQQNGTAVDLTAFMPADTATLDVIAPDGVTSTGWRIEFAGPSHPKTVESNNEVLRRQLRRQSQLEAQQANNRKVKVEEKDPEEMRRENVRWVVARMLGWTPVLIRSIQPEPIGFSPEVAMSLFVRPEMGWAFSQIVDFLGNERSFTRASGGA